MGLTHRAMTELGLFLEQHWRLALWVARRRAEQAGWRGDPQDVESDATWGLLQAARTWQPSRGSPETWVRLRVENAITDGLRHRWGDTRKNGKALMTATTDSLDRTVQTKPPATLGEITPDPVDHITRASDRADLHKALQNLHPRERDTITRWLNGEPLRAIGARYGVTESRASQINTAARRKLQRALSSTRPPLHPEWGPSVRSRARRSPTVSAGLSRMRGCRAVSPCRQTDNGGAMLAPGLAVLPRSPDRSPDRFQRTTHQDCPLFQPHHDSPMPEYRIVFKQPPGGHPARAPEYLDADDDTDALEKAAARYTREDHVIAVHGMGANRWSMWRVWVQN